MNGVSLYIEGEKVELSEKEGINIKLNTQDINDISKVNAGYSKDFSVMASKSNNKLFKHYYNADIIGGFDARTKKKATIYLDDLFFISGRIRLTSTVIENNLIVSYRIQFEGDVVNVKDVLGDKKISDLNLSAYNHEYNSGNVLQGLTSSLFSGSVVYPLISSVNRWLYDSSNAYLPTENSKNINYDSADDEQSISYTELKPALKIADIINQIQIDNNINFVGDFFNRDYYNNLFLWFSNNEGLINLSGNLSEYLLNFNAGDTDLIDLSTDTLTLSFATLQFSLDLRSTITPTTQFESTLYNFVVTVNGTEFFRQDNNSGTQTFECIINKQDYPSGNVKFYLEGQSNIIYSANVRQRVKTTNTFFQEYNTQANNNSVTGQVDLSKQAPDIKQIDVITGIIKMFNIALTADINGNIIWETLPDWYRNGKEYKDFEKYIDNSKTTISRGKLNNEFDFKYEDPNTILAEQFKKTNPDAYGDISSKLLEDPNDPNSELIDGSKLEINVPFENMVYERLRNLATNTNIDFQYGLSLDESLNPAVPKGLIFYNNSLKTETIGFRLGSGNAIALNTSLNTPNNTNSLTDNTKQSLNFGSEISTYNFSLMNNTLYNNFYSDYISDMFNKQRRLYVFNAIIPNFILANIKLNDRLIISNKRYIINSINSNLTTGKTKLELLNDLYEAGDLIGGDFYAIPDFFNVSVSGADIQSIVYNNGLTVNSLIDEGDGIFASITTVTPFTGTKTLGMNVQPNTTGSQRVMSVLCTSGAKSFKITILQDAESVDFSSTDITFDNNNLTFDNNI